MRKSCFCRIRKTTQLANYLPLGGGTLNGSITLNRLVAGNNLTETAYNTTDVIALSKYRTPIVFILYEVMLELVSSLKIIIQSYLAMIMQFL